MQFPKHISLSIEHNQHRNCYVPLEQYFDHYPYLENVDEAEKRKCIESDSMWEIQWYINSPISFHHVFASTLERALELMKQVSDV